MAISIPVPPRRVGVDLSQLADQIRGQNQQASQQAFAQRSNQALQIAQQQAAIRQALGLPSQAKIPPPPQYTTLYGRPPVGGGGGGESKAPQRPPPWQPAPLTFGPDLPSQPYPTGPSEFDKQKALAAQGSGGSDVLDMTGNQSTEMPTPSPEAVASLVGQGLNPFGALAQYATNDQQAASVDPTFGGSFPGGAAVPAAGTGAGVNLANEVTGTSGGSLPPSGVPAGADTTGLSPGYYHENGNVIGPGGQVMGPSDNYYGPGNALYDFRTSPYFGGPGNSAGDVGAVAAAPVDTAPVSPDMGIGFSGSGGDF